MRNQGRIITWNDDRGFGFIAPNNSNKKIFVNFTSFIKRNRRPRVDDWVTYDSIADGERGQRADNVEYLGMIEKWQVFAQDPKQQPQNKLTLILLFLILCNAALYASEQWTAGERFEPIMHTANIARQSDIIESVTSKKKSFQCKGKHFCSEMASCAEATYYLQHCPDTQLDGDNDGIPCESQWCH